MLSICVGSDEARHFAVDFSQPKWPRGSWMPDHSIKPRQRTPTGAGQWVIERVCKQYNVLLARNRAGRPASAGQRSQRSQPIIQSFLLSRSLRMVKRGSRSASVTWSRHHSGSPSAPDRQLVKSVSCLYEHAPNNLCARSHISTILYPDVPA